MADDAKRPDATSVAPLIGLWECSVGHGQAVDLLNGLQIVSPPRVQIDEEWQEQLGGSSMDELNGAQWALQYSYKGDPNAHLGPLEEEASEILKRAQIALWIARPTGASIRYVLRYRDPWHDDNVTGVIRQLDWIKPHEKYERSTIEPQDLDDLKTLAAKVQSVYKDQLALRRTLYHLNGALHMWYWDTRFVMFTVVLESLFTTDASEITHKMSERVAWFLGKDRAERRALFDLVKRIYRIRSKIVHGAEVRNLTPPESSEVLAELESIVQRSLRKILVEDSLISVFGGKNQPREEYLLSMMFE